MPPHAGCSRRPDDHLSLLAPQAGRPRCTRAPQHSGLLAPQARGGARAGAAAGCHASYSTVPRRYPAGARGGLFQSACVLTRGGQKKDCHQPWARLPPYLVDREAVHGVKKSRAASGRPCKYSQGGRGRWPAYLLAVFYAGPFPWRLSDGLEAQERSPRTSGRLPSCCGRVLHRRPVGEPHM